MVREKRAHARNHESVARSITQLQTASIRNSCEVPINVTRQAYSNAGVRRFCSRCEEKHFTPAECQHRFTICNFCKKRGHIAKVCFAKKEHYQTPARVHAVEEDSLQDVETIYQVQQTCNLADPPYEVTLKVDGHPVKFELDSGASSTLLHESAIRILSTLHPPQISFISATVRGSRFYASSRSLHGRG